jgi:hypothetical protein
MAERHKNRNVFHTLIMQLFFVSCIDLLFVVSTALGDSTIDASLKYAWSANSGWINFRHDKPVSPAGIIFGEYVLSGYAFAANVGWISLGSGTPANGIRYLNNSGTDFGVNHDGSGNLSGYAYGANIGWINFGWATATDVNRPRVNLLTGTFTGFAYSANLGWINLGSAYLKTIAMRITDSDGDGIADEWERINFNNLITATATSDYDHDGILDIAEYPGGTDPKSATSFFKVASTSYNANFTQATVIFATSPTRNYRLETSATLLPGSWEDSGLGTFSPDSGTTTTRVISWVTSASRFIRAVSLVPFTP